MIKSTYADINNPANSIIGTDTIRVVRPPSVNVGASVINLNCNGGNNGSFTVNPIGGTGPFEYSINGGTTYQSSNTFTGLSGGTYTVRIHDIGSTCLRDTAIIVTEPSALTETVSTTNATCSPTPNGTITVTAGGGVPGYTYSIDGVNYQASNTFNVISGTYDVSIKDLNGCTKTVSATVDLTNDLSLGVRADTTICKGASIVLTTTSNAASYSWSPSTGLNDPYASNPLASPTDPTLYTVTATLGQCTKTASVNVGVVQAVQVFAGQDITLISGDQAQINAVAQSATTYLWTPPTGLSATNILNPIVKPDVTTNYTITVKNDVGCSASDDLLVTVIPYCVRVRNAFTPNGDGINDYWLVYDNRECLKNVAVHVFNRYGNSVYESKDYTNTWDGRYKGKSVPDGTYYGVVEFTLITGKVVTVKTDLTILR